MITVITPELKELLKEEYLHTDTSIRKLASKYDIERNRLGKIVTGEHWALLKKAESEKTTETTCEQVRDEVITAIFTDRERNEFLRLLADKTAMKYRQIVELDEPLSPRDIKSLTSAMVDLMGIYGIKSAADTREQEARIKSLESKTEDKSLEDRAITVVFGNGEDLV